MCHPAGETLPDTTCVYRVRVVTAMLKLGIPLVKIDIQLNQPQASGPFCPSRGNDSVNDRYCLNKKRIIGKICEHKRIE